jgi:hypothetical protein
LFLDRLGIRYKVYVDNRKGRKVVYRVSIVKEYWIDFIERIGMSIGRKMEKM